MPTRRVLRGFRDAPHALGAVRVMQSTSHALADAGAGEGDLRLRSPCHKPEAPVREVPAPRRLALLWPVDVEPGMIWRPFRGRRRRAGHCRHQYRHFSIHLNPRRRFTDSASTERAWTGPTPCGTMIDLLLQAQDLPVALDVEDGRAKAAASGARHKGLW